jgi:hypothetical protein
LIEYVDISAVRANAERLPNPIIYSYFKDKGAFEEEDELRITLATVGIGNFALGDHTIINFPQSMQLAFDLREAYADGAITQLMCQDDRVVRHLAQELARFSIQVNPASQ